MGSQVTSIKLLGNFPEVTTQIGKLSIIHIDQNKWTVAAIVMACFGNLQTVTSESLVLGTVLKTKFKVHIAIVVVVCGA